MRSQRGIVHLVPIIVIAAVVAGGVGYAYRNKLPFIPEFLRSKAAGSPPETLVQKLGPYNCIEQTSNKLCKISFPMIGGNDYQISKVTYTFNYRGHQIGTGLGGTNFGDLFIESIRRLFELLNPADRAVSLSMCISAIPNQASGKCLSPPFFYKKSSDFITKKSTGILEIDDTDKTPYRYLNLAVFAQHAITSTYVTMEARSLRPTFTKLTVCSGGICDITEVGKNQIINVAWTIGNAKKVKISSSGPVTKLNFANATKLPDGNATFKATKKGKAVFTVEATGFNGKVVKKVVKVNILDTVPPVSNTLCGYTRSNVTRCFKGTDNLPDTDCAVLTRPACDTYGCNAYPKAVCDYTL